MMFRVWREARQRLATATDQLADSRRMHAEDGSRIEQMRSERERFVQVIRDALAVPFHPAPASPNGHNGSKKHA